MKLRPRRTLRVKKDGQDVLEFCTGKMKSQNQEPPEFEKD